MPMIELAYDRLQVRYDMMMRMAKRNNIPEGQSVGPRASAARIEAAMLLLLDFVA
jgi:hypothetical protein